MVVDGGDRHSDRGRGDQDEDGERDGAPPLHLLAQWSFASHSR
jgi:hypothetical protein